jgi:hypothetical protein
LEQAMSTMLDEALDAEDAAPRRRWPRVLGALVVLALIGAGIGAAVYVHTYQPLGAGDITYSIHGSARQVSDGVEDPTRYIIVGPAGSVGTFGFTIANNGRYSVRILGSDVPPGMLVEPRLRWAPWPDSHAQSFADGLPFPATVGPGQQIALFISITKPKCDSAAGAELPDIGLRTEALGVHHDWDLWLGGTGSFAPIDACLPADDHPHIVKS